jgi:hypothetical protein
MFAVSKKLTLEMITKPWMFGDRINEIGTTEGFEKWWNTQIYHKIKEHEYSRIDKILLQYERYSETENSYTNLSNVASSTENPELYNPVDDKLYVFLPDAYGEKKFRLSEFSGCGRIERHHPFDNRESAILFASKKGCTELRPGLMDQLMETISFEQSVAKYEAQNANMHIDEYIMKTKVPRIIELFKDRIEELKTHNDKGLLSKPSVVNCSVRVKP